VLVVEALVACGEHAFTELLQGESWMAVTSSRQCSGCVLFLVLWPYGQIHFVQDPICKGPAPYAGFRGHPAVSTLGAKVDRHSFTVHIVNECLESGCAALVPQHAKVCGALSPGGACARSKLASEFVGYVPGQPTCKSSSLARGREAGREFSFRRI